MLPIFNPVLSTGQRLATRYFEAAVARERMAHAYLLTGYALQDKWSIARELAQYFNCLSPSKSTKGSCLIQAYPDSLGTTCQNCRWIGQGQHPQAWLTLEGESPGSSRIPVEAARLLSQEIAKSSTLHRVVVIPDASDDCLHRPAANALLKTIEEPGPSCLFFLFAALPDQVLPTMVSRCQLVRLSNPDLNGVWLSHRGKASADRPNEKLKSIQDELSPMKADGLGSDAAALKWTERLLSLAGEGLSHSHLIDLAVSAEWDELRPTATGDLAVSLYVNRLMELSQVAQSQIQSSVGIKALVESFALSRRALVHQLQGEATVDYH